ncbi:hypothetical protein DRB80_01960 [Salmonella enterica]|uniref:Uncharacterized protein n=3 Tax=Salmonella enterica TaxID=28901 RepID=A0A344SMJ1_SALER|nr:hypothetical protein CHD54_07105 [Salmonella enterica]EAA3680214.1 hypothetical protein [Salmonella enterica subsp. houtenae]EAA7384741.1 hypothetical protein [Salmonella enterica subsp. enterica]EBH8099118.1 hypothetical protein [Salmonella enterica subsp. houtenae serovar O:11:g,z25:-]EBH8333349.1 hypothetical protein [Salmonella enterica subsp. houtenae serovar Houten]EBX0545920.1 hypothetical protein [Salmonella enterica subsp. houtenae serovar 44:z4,z23:-]ECT3982542.1 hypothetical pro
MPDGAALIRLTAALLVVPEEIKSVMALNIFSAPFLFTRGKEIPTQTFSFSVRMRPEQDDRA